MCSTFHKRITKYNSSQSAFFPCDLWCLIQTKACSYLPASSPSLLWTFTSHVMPLVPLLLLNKEAYRGLPLWSYSVFCFFLRALLSEAFPTVQRQTHFTVGTREKWTPLHNNNTDKKKKKTQHVSSAAFLCSHRHGNTKLHTPLSVHNRHNCVGYTYTLWLLYRLIMGSSQINRTHRHIYTTLWLDTRWLGHNTQT